MIEETKTTTRTYAIRYRVFGLHAGDSTLPYPTQRAAMDSIVRVAASWKATGFEVVKVGNTLEKALWDDEGIKHIFASLEYIEGKTE